MDVLLVNLLHGLSWGMLLFLTSTGLTTIFGVAGVLNFAHGALFMLGGYAAMQLGLWTGSFWAGLVLAPAAVAALGGILERALLRPVYGRHVSFQLLLTFALLLVLEDGVRLVWGSGYHVVSPPALLAGTVAVAGYGFPVYRLFLVVLGPLLGVGLWAMFAFTRIGKVVRAAAADREMAMALGIHVPRLFTGVFAFGTALAALVGSAGASANPAASPPATSPPTSRPAAARRLVPAARWPALAARRRAPPARRSAPAVRRPARAVRRDAGKAG